MKFKVHIHPCEEGGFAVSVPALPGCYSAGKTREEALENIKESIELWLEPISEEEMNELGIVAEVTV
jgi:predicted RNase H-like HicB family nuclease